MFAADFAKKEVVEKEMFIFCNSLGIILNKAVVKTVQIAILSHAGCVTWLVGQRNIL